MKVVILALFCLALACQLARACEDVIKEEWHNYKKQFGKSYPDPAEDARRLANYLKTKKKLEGYNKISCPGYFSVSDRADWDEWEKDHHHPKGLSVDKRAKSLRRESNVPGGLNRYSMFSESYADETDD